jgi:hypothetical protein
MRSDPDMLSVEFRDFTGTTIYRSAVPRRSTGVGKAA